MEKMDKIQIDTALFVNLMRFHLGGEEFLQEDIQKALKAKIEAMSRRKLYSTYKTANTQEEREKARQEYLDEIGLREDWRW